MIVHAKRARRTGRWWVAAAAVLVLAAAAAAVGLARSGDSPPAQRGLPSAATATPTARDFDPLGDGREDTAEVANVIDGNPATAWRTEQYVNFTQTKAGVGLVLDLGRLSVLRSVTVTTLQSGWSAAVYTSERTPDALAALDTWGPVRAHGAGLGNNATLDVGSRRARSVLVWFTALPGLRIQLNSSGGRAPGAP